MSATSQAQRGDAISAPVNRNIRLRGLSAAIAGDRLLLVSGAIILVYLFVALFGPYLLTKSPYALDPLQVYQRPSSDAWFGTDQYGRDEFSRTITAARYTLIGVGGVFLIAVGGGYLMGLITGYFGGWFDSVMMRAFDVILSVPPLLVAILLVAALGPGLATVVIGVGLGYLPGIARMIRSEAKVQRNEQYVTAARGLGYPSRRIILRHVMPNTTSQVIVQGSMNVPYAIIDLAGLSFLGFGLQPPTPDWGNMLADGAKSVLFAPWLVIFPGLAVSLLALTWNIFGARLRRAIDPTLAV